MAVTDWISDYKVGVVESLEESGGKGTKALKICRVNIGDGTIQVVTSAPNVRLQSRLVVAPVGSTVLGSDGEGMTVTKSTIGGHTSEGIFCDSRMLGWEGGSVGIAARMEDALPLGSAPPSKKPRPGGGGGDGQASTELPESQVEGLFKKKLTKEEKKKLAEEKRKARKAAKEAKMAAEGGGD